jgi:hypothetical protein
MGIKYQHQDYRNILYDFSNMDWANDKDTRQSTSSYCFMLVGGVVTWVSKKQTFVVLSNTI